MSITLRPLNQQVIFITDATSRIGQATVHHAVEQGAKVFMVGRNEDELQQIQDEMRKKAYDTAFSVADVCEIDQIQFAVDQCLKTFGGIDTFVNNAGVSIFETFPDTNFETTRKKFETNFWGMVNGCKVAVPALKDNGGVIINIGSIPPKVSLPIQGIFLASNFANKGYIDVLRRELLSQKTPIQVTLILSPMIGSSTVPNNPSRFGETRIPPVLTEDLVAKAILKCAVKKTREVRIGTTSLLLPKWERFVPFFQNKFRVRSFFRRIRIRQHRNQMAANKIFVAPMHEGIVLGHHSAVAMPRKLAWPKGLAILSGFGGRFRFF